MNKYFRRAHPNIAIFKDMLEKLCKDYPDLTLSELNENLEKEIQENTAIELNNICIGQINGTVSNCTVCGQPIRAGLHLCEECRRRRIV